jgi:glutaredoxin-like protein
MSLFDDKIKKQLKELLAGMKDDVELIYFTQEMECQECKEGREFAEEFSELSDKIKYSKFDFQKDQDEVKKYHVMRIPAMVISKNGNDSGVKFYGVPGGYEINSFISTIMEMSGTGQELSPELIDRIKKIDKEVHFQVFVTLSCPHCPGAVAAAHRLAMENPNIKADMIDSSIFPHLAVKYQVQGVPKTVVNEKKELMGAQPIQAFIEAAENA